MTDGSIAQSLAPAERTPTTADGPTKLAPTVDRGSADIRISLLTGGEDRHYAYGLTFALVDKGVFVDFVGSDSLDGAEIRNHPSIRFLNLRGSHSGRASRAEKVRRVAVYYARLIAYAAGAPAAVFHILWNNKFQTFDRTLLMLYYRALGKRVVLTAHNVNAGKRDTNDTLLNRLTLKVQYKLCDQVFVHTNLMKQQLVDEFSVRSDAVTVIPYGINNAVPDTAVTRDQARQHFGIDQSARTILCFGAIAPYKGLEYLVSAFERLLAGGGDYRLIIAGKPKPGAADYWREIAARIAPLVQSGRVVAHPRFIEDAEAELYFKAADVLVLPYREIFQSGMLFFGYSFGLPVVASDVGSLRDDIIDGRTGFVCRPEDPVALTAALESYFSSDLFANLDRRRKDIKAFAEAHHSWETVAELTRDVYASLTPARAHV